MKRMRLVLVLAIGAALAPGAKADVKTQEKNLVKLGGALGRIAGMFGGKAMRDGVISTVALKGDRKMEVNEYTGEIVDLAEEKVYSLDMKKKTYEAVTFEEMRRRMQEAMQKASESAREQKPDKEEASKEPEKEMEIEFSMKETGQQRTIGGYDCHEVLLTITTHEKGKTLEESGGIVMTSHMWQAPQVPELKELQEFNMRYAKALLGTDMAAAAGQMATVMAMYPAMKDMMAKAQAENVKLDGTTILNETIVEAVASPEQMKQQGEQEKAPSGIGSMGGFGGMLGRKMMRKKEDDSAGKDAAAKNRTNIATVTHEFLSVSKEVAAGDVSIPAGFKEKKK